MDIPDYGNRYDHSKVFFCMRMRMYNWLTDRGWSNIATIQDPNNPNYNIWLFYRTPAFDRDCVEYYRWTKKKKKI